MTALSVPLVATLRLATLHPGCRADHDRCDVLGHTPSAWTAYREDLPKLPVASAVRASAPPTR